MSLGAFSSIGSYCIDCGRKNGKNFKRCRRCNNASRRLPSNKCVDCGTIILRGSKRCQICCYKDPIRNQKLSKARIADWKNDVYGTDEHRSNLSKGQKACWTPTRRKEKSDWIKMAYATGILGTEEHRQNLSIANQRRADRGEFRTEEWRKKQSGSNCNFWRGGISYQPYGIEWNNALKRTIKSRDHYCCRVCGNRENDNHPHHVHHINYQKDDNRPENLITLCVRCHAYTGSNRSYWTTLFHLEILYIYSERIENETLDDLF